MQCGVNAWSGQCAARRPLGIVLVSSDDVDDDVGGGGGVVLLFGTKQVCLVA